jgi:hypothetical protein
MFHSVLNSKAIMLQTAMLFAVLFYTPYLASAQGTREPSMNIVVRQDGARVIFEFYGESWPGVMKRMSANHLTVQGPDGRQAMWSVVAPFGKGALEIQYGEVPYEFRQLVPPADLPPALVTGQEYFVTAILDVAPGSARQKFVYRGN